jgi:hypothetical protein
MPTIFSTKIQANRQKKSITLANRVKISRITREVHAAAKKLFTKILGRISALPKTARSVSVHFDPDNSVILSEHLRLRD